MVWFTVPLNAKAQLMKEEEEKECGRQLS